MKFFKTLGLLLLIGVFLAACQSPKVRYDEKPDTANLTQYQQQLLRRIAASGIVVVKEGMIYTFIVPTDCFFDYQSQKLKQNREQDLLLVADFINQYAYYFKTLQASITGYTDKVWLYPARKKLSLYYAKSIANVLIEDNVNISLKVAGMGAKNAIASNRYPAGSVYNRRVEIIVK